MASPVVESLWRKPATRPQVALARAAATTGAVVVLWGLLRLGGVWPVHGSDVSRMVLGRGRAGIVTAPSDTALSVDGATSGGDDRPAVLTENPSAADLEGIRECKDAARNYMLTHLKDFHAENGAWGLKSALLALRGALVDAGPEAAAADNGPAAPLVVDVGANRGQNVPVWRAIYGEAAHLVLVEGNPAAARTLSTNFADKSDSVAVVQRLVGNSTAEMHFRVPKGETSLERAAIQAEESVGLFPDEFDYVVRSALCHWLPAAHGWSVGLIGRRLGRVFSGKVSSWSCLLTRTLVPSPFLPFPSSPHPSDHPPRLGGMLFSTLRTFVFWHSQKLPVETLDEILTNPALVPAGWVDPSRRYPIDFLKIDTEGWDVTALQGAPAVLQRTRFVLWECHLLMALVNGPGTTHGQAAELLASHGFESYKVSPQFVRFDGAFSMPEVDERANMGWQNCFAIRSDDPLRPELLGRFNHLFQCVKPLKLMV